MAIINDPDQITPGTEVTVTTATETITLNNGSGQLSEDGITGQALYSYLKEEWKDDNEGLGYIKFTFPMLAITPEQFEFGNNGSKFSNWQLASASRDLMRKAGWREYDDAGTNLREYIGAVTLGNIDSTSKTVGDKAYYYFENDTDVTEFTYAGPVDEPIQIFGDVNNGNFDKRSEVLTVRIRVFGKTYDESTSTAIGLTSLTYNVQRFPLAESTDNVISDLGVTTGDIDANTPYTDMSIAWFAVAQSRSGFTTGSHDFGLIIDGDVSEAQQDGGGAASAEQIYAYVQRRLLLDTDINDGAGGTATVYKGRFVEELLSISSTGNTLSSLQLSVNAEGGGTGVYVDSFASSDTTRVSFVDNTGTARTFPFVAAGDLQFNANLQNDASAYYWLYYQYTRQTDATDISVTSAATNTATITTGGNVDFTATGDFGAGALTQNDYIELTGFSNAENNGIWQITGVVAATSFAASKVNGENVVNEGPLAVSIFRSPEGSPDATVVNDNSATPIEGLVGGNATIGFDYDFDGDTTGGRDVTVNAACVLRVIGLATAQYSEANQTLSQSTSLAFPVVAVLERNYLT